MYSGEISSPKELQAMQADVEQLRRHQRTIENRELELMEVREPLDATVGDLEQQRAALVAEIDGAPAALGAAEAEIIAEMQAERAARDELAGEHRPASGQASTSAAARSPRAPASRAWWAPRARAVTSRSPPSRRSRSSARVASRIAYCDNCGAILVP